MFGLFVYWKNQQNIIVGRIRRRTVGSCCFWICSGPDQRNWNRIYGFNSRALGCYYYCDYCCFYEFVFSVLVHRDLRWPHEEEVVAFRLRQVHHGESLIRELVGECHWWELVIPTRTTKFAAHLVFKKVRVEKKIFKHYFLEKKKCEFILYNQFIILLF